MIELQLDGPDGIIEVVIQRIEYCGKEVFEVDMWRTDIFLQQKIVHFSASCFMAWNGERFAIFTPTRYMGNNANQFWRDLEYTIGCHIEVNT